MKTLDKNTLVFRRSISSFIVLIFFLFLVYGFVRLQVSNKDIYIQKSINNSIRKIQQYPVRGLILDRDHDILVDNRPSFSAAVIPKIFDNKSFHFVSDLLNLDSSELKIKIRKNYGFRPVIISRDINTHQVIQIEENRLNLPGVLTIVEPKRFYPDSINSPHIFGSVGEVSSAEQILNPGYDQGDLIGKAGLERKYDRDLRGSKGVRFVRVDAIGKEMGSYDKNRDVLPLHGSDLYLHMDYNLQKFAEQLLEGQRGALVALDVRNGGVIALASKPDYDPRLLTGKIDPKVWNSLLNDESHPLYSRAIQSGYPPGSTYKMVAAIAALQENIVDPSWSVHCPGYFRLGRRTIHCWNAKGHGTVDMKGAIKGSCNVYFYQLGLKIGLDSWSKYSKLFGFGAKTEIDLPNENSGLVPTTEFFNKVYGVNGWTRGNLANLAIGQGELLTTPLQIAQFTMILANRGVYHAPHMVDHLYSYSAGKNIKFPRETKYVRGISDEVYEVVREGMHEVVNGGTGWAGKVYGIDMAGKTGTAQNPHGDSHAWFMAFAPYEYPEVAISVIVENGGGGSAVAAPIARKFLEMYFYGRVIPRAVAKKDSSAQSTIENQLPAIDLNRIRPMQIFLPNESN